MEFQSNQLDDDQVPDPDITGEVFYDFHAVIRRYYPYICFYGSLMFVAVCGLLAWFEGRHSNGIF